MAWTPLFLTLLTHYTGAWILGLRMWPQEDAGLCPSPWSPGCVVGTQTHHPCVFLSFIPGTWAWSGLTQEASVPGSLGPTVTLVCTGNSHDVG